MSILNEALDLTKQCQSLILATKGMLSEEPEASYAPFVTQNNALYIFVSELAAHTKNMQAHPHCSAFIIEDEKDTRNIFARKRLNLSCICEDICKDSDEWTEIINTMESTLGNTISVLKALPDFHLLRLTPQSGTFVKGFGAAYSIEANLFTSEESDINQVTR